MTEPVLEQYEVDDNGPRLIVREMLTSSKAADLWLGDLQRRGYSRRTIDTYRRIVYQFCDRLPDDLDIARVTGDDVRRFLDQWNRKSAGTRAHAYSVVSSFFRWLYHTERVKRNPMDRLERPRRLPAEDLDVVAVTADDVRALLAAARGWPERLAIAIPAYMGPRRRAAALLRLRDYDREHGRIRFREKGGKVIWKPVPTELQRMLEAAIAEGAIAGEDAYLIPNEGPRAAYAGDRDRDDRVVWRLVKNVAARAGVSAHVHSLRAAFAVFYLERNPGDLEGLKELLGHRSLSTTQIYLRKMNRGAAMERVRDLSWEAEA